MFMSRRHFLLTIIGASSRFVLPFFYEEPRNNWGNFDYPLSVDNIIYQYSTVRGEE